MTQTKVELTPSDRLSQSRTRMADEVAHVLREHILNGELQAGTPLLQIQLADRLGVSRTPLREAFRILERDGLVRISNGNKTVEVVRLDPARLIETYEVREVIDGLAARLAARKGLTPEATERIAGYIKAMEDASTPSLSAARYSRPHADFHLAVIDASDNSRLKDFVPLVRLSSHMLLTRYLNQHEPADLEATISRVICEGNEDHRRIFDAIRLQDPVAAEAAATRHIEKTTTFTRDLALTLARSDSPSDATV